MHACCMEQQLLLQKLLRGAAAWSMHEPAGMHAHGASAAAAAAAASKAAACMRAVRGCLRDENRRRLPLAVTSFWSGQIAKEPRTPTVNTVLKSAHFLVTLPRTSWHDTCRFTVVYCPIPS